MTGSLTWLAVAIAFFAAIHLVISGTPVRGSIVALIGDRIYGGLFALAAAFGLGWTAWAYHDAPVDVLWHAVWLPWIPVVVMPFAWILLVCGVSTPNAMAPAPSADGHASAPVKGIIRITRHPIMWGVSLWAAAHLIANGDTASVLMFGGLISVALFGPLQADAKNRRRLGEAWTPLAAQTSWLPFAAAIVGRTRISLGEIGWWRLALGLVVYVVTMGVHPLVFGVPPWPV
jgi:uncharacterized membrane protein